MARAKKTTKLPKIQDAEPVLTGDVLEIHDETPADAGPVLVEAVEVLADVEPAGAPAAKPAKNIAPKYQDAAAFFRDTAGYEDRRATIYYLYRVWPIIDRARTGNQNYIDKARELTEGDVLARWGSGQYKVIFCDDARPPGKTRISETYLGLNDSDHPPVVDTDELVIGRSENRTFIENLRAKGVIDQMGNKIVQAGAPAAAGNDGVVEVVRELLKDRTPDATQRAQEASVSMMQKGFETVLTAAANARQNSGGISDLRELLGLLRELQPAAPAPAPSFFGNLAELKEGLGTLRELGLIRGGGGGGGGVAAPASRGMDTVAAVVQALPGIIQQGLTFYSLIRSDMAAARGVAGVPGGVPVAMPPALPINNPMPPADQEDGAAINSDGSMNIAKLLKLGNRAIDAYQKGMAGFEFAAALDAMEGEQTYDALAALGVEQVLTFMRMSPPMAAMLQRPGEETKVREWLQAFVDYGKPEDEPTGGVAQ